jgi:ubiquinone/menaquinone biosynthesis C-methylase UbiE
MALKRILEPEVMDTETDAVEYDSMDFADVNLSFALRALDLAPSSGRVLDIGTGTARIPIVMVQQGRKNIHIHAIDLSREMLKVAKTNVEAARVHDSISLQLVDAKGFPFADKQFDMVISNSVTHHIPEPLAFFSEVARVVRPGGSIFIRDLMRPETPEALEQLVNTYAGDADPYQQKLYRDSLAAALTVAEVEGLLRLAGIHDVHVMRSSDRHWSAERQAAL